MWRYGNHAKECKVLPEYHIYGNAIVCTYSTSEINAAQYMTNLGNDVVLRPPVGTRGRWWNVRFVGKWN